MNIHELSLKMATLIVTMKDGDISSIARLAHAVLDDHYGGDMFSLMQLVIYECAKRGIYLDYSDHNGKVEGLPYNLTFVVRRSKCVGAPIEDAYVCVFHHSTVNQESRPHADPKERPVERVVIYFSGSLGESKNRYFKNDDGSGFTIDCVQVDKDSFVLALIDGAYRYPVDACTGTYGEKTCLGWWFSEPAENWTFIVSKSPVDLPKAMEGYRQVAEGEFVWIYDGEE